jgi:hypothetical protein
MRVYRSVNADGSGATELTSATQVGTTSATLSTSADVTSVVTWSPGVTITLNNEYLFFVVAWEITTQGGSNTADVQIRTGQSAAGSRLVTPDFAVSRPIPPTTNITNSQAVSGDIVARVAIRPTTNVTNSQSASGTLTKFVPGGPVPVVAAQISATNAVSGAVVKGPVKAVTGNITNNQAVSGNLPRPTRPVTPAGITNAQSVSGGLVIRRIVVVTGVTLTNTVSGVVTKAIPQTVPIGRRAAATVVYGVYLTAPFPITDYTSRWDAANTGSLTFAGGFIHKIQDIGSPVNDMTGAPDPEYGARQINSIIVPDYGGVTPGLMQAPLVTNQTVKTVFIVAQADSIGGIRPILGGDQSGGFEIRANNGAIELVRNGVTTIVAHPTPIAPGTPFIISAVVNG